MGGVLCGWEGVRVVCQRCRPDPRRLLCAHVHVQVAAPGSVLRHVGAPRRNDPPRGDQDPDQASDYARVVRGQGAGVRHPTRVGRSGQHYTHAWAFTLYLEDDASTKEGFRIATVIAGHDTEMLMNMAEREQLSDTYTCPKIGNWSEAVTHTIMQP